MQVVPFFVEVPDSLPALAVADTDDVMRAGAGLSMHLPPFVMVAQEKYARPRGINAEGLKRRGFDAGRIAAIKRAYRALYMGDAKLDEAKVELGEIAGGSDDVRAMLDFIERGERPLLR